jgi:hypothetical protein
MAETLKTFVNRAAQVAYMISQDQNPAAPLPVGSTLRFRITSTTNAFITALYNGDPSVPYGYSVTAPNQGTTDYTTDNDGDLESCANLASSQVDSIFSRPASAQRKAYVNIP